MNGKNETTDLWETIFTIGKVVECCRRSTLTKNEWGHVIITYQRGGMFLDLYLSDWESSKELYDATGDVDAYLKVVQRLTKDKSFRSYLETINPEEPIHIFGVSDTLKLPLLRMICVDLTPHQGQLLTMQAIKHNSIEGNTEIVEFLLTLPLESIVELLDAAMDEGDIHVCRLVYKKLNLSDHPDTKGALLDDN